MVQLSMNSLAANIHRAAAIEDLAVLRESLLEYAHDRPFVFFDDPAVEVKAVNRIYDLLIHKVVSLCEDQAVESGMGKPPAAYDFFLVGSGGRSEQTLWSDQDHGLVFGVSEHESPETTQAYFLEFGALVTKSLIKLGFPPCEGEVLCQNKRWCRSETSWNSAVDEWLESSEWEDIRYLLILSDLRPLFGEGIMTAHIRNGILSALKERRELAPRLLENTLRHKILLNIFGHIIKEPYGENAGGIDVKYGAYIPFVNGIRCLSLLNGIEPTSTMDRISALQTIGILSQSQAEKLHEAFAFFIGLRARSTYSGSGGMYMSSGVFDPAKLSKSELQELKRNLRIGKALQRFLKQFVERMQE